MQSENIVNTESTAGPPILHLDWSLLYKKQERCCPSSLLADNDFLLAHIFARLGICNTEKGMQCPRNYIHAFKTTRHSWKQYNKPHSKINGQGLQWVSLLLASGLIRCANILPKLETLLAQSNSLKRTAIAITLACQRNQGPLKPWISPRPNRWRPSNTIRMPHDCHCQI